jgi:hypothetical protein
MQPGDIYEDKNGSKWAVVGLWTEPVVVMERVWPPNDADRQTAGINGLLWQGFRKLRPASAEET